MAQRFRFGDVFEVDLGQRTVGYFQYISTDYTQLSSDVVRAFSYVGPALKDLDQVISSGTKFHAHVFLRAGLTLNV